MTRWIRTVLVLAALAGCRSATFRRSTQVDTTRERLDRAKVDLVLTESLRRTRRRHGACAYGPDALTTFEDGRTALVAYPSLTVNRLTPPPTAASRVDLVPAAAPAGSAGAVALELDLEQLTRLTVGRTDGRCGDRNRLYMVTVAFAADDLSIEVPPDELIDVLAALTWKKQVPILDAADVAFE
jgi:hypothetical protein